MSESKPRKSLATYSPERLRQWVHKSLRQVDNGAEPPIAYAAVSADRALKNMIKRLKEDFPAREWTAPSGVVWPGTALPPEVLNTVLLQSESERLRGNMLNMGVEVLGNDYAHVRWLLASGFNPNRFSPENKNTPVGALAMRGKHAGLRACREAGYDLRAMINKEHLGSIPKERHGMLLGTNLLHRVAQHCVRMKDQRVAVKTINELLLAGIDPRDQAANGKTALDMATGAAVETLQAWIAHRQAQELNQGTCSASAKARPPRL